MSAGYADVLGDDDPTGGRSSCSRSDPATRGRLALGPLSDAIRRVAGPRLFRRDELTAELRRHGLTDIRQQVAGLAQFVSGRVPR